MFSYELNIFAVRNDVINFVKYRHTQFFWVGARDPEVFLKDKRDKQQITYVLNFFCLFIEGNRNLVFKLKFNIKTNISYYDPCIVCFYLIYLKIKKFRIS